MRKDIEARHGPYVWKQQTLFAFLEGQLSIGCIICEVALCIVLAKRGLVGRYSWLFSLALTNAFRDLILLRGFGIASPNYGRAWAATLPILMYVQIGTVLDGYKKLAAQYHGLGVFASRLLLACLAVLGFTSLLSLPWEVKHWDIKHSRQSMLQTLLLLYRYFVSVLAGSLALPCLYLWRFPKPDKHAPRNLAVHLGMLLSYFGVYIAAFLCANVLGIRETTITVINSAMLAILCCTYLSWALLLTEGGEVSLPWPKLHHSLLATIHASNAAAVYRGERLKHQFWHNHRRPPNRNQF